jgi:hypothetical protein
MIAVSTIFLFSLKHLTTTEMTIPEALEKLDQLQAQIIHGGTPFKDIADAIRQHLKTEALLAKVELMRSGNTAILPTGEIVARGTPGATDYDSSNSIQAAVKPLVAACYSLTDTDDWRGVAKILVRCHALMATHPELFPENENSPSVGATEKAK